MVKYNDTKKIKKNAVKHGKKWRFYKGSKFGK